MHVTMVSTIGEGGMAGDYTVHINLSNITSSNTELLCATKFTVHVQLTLVYTVQ